MRRWHRAIAAHGGKKKSEQKKRVCFGLSLKFLLQPPNSLICRTIVHTPRFAGPGAQARNHTTADPADLVWLDLRRPREEGDRCLVP